MYLELSKAMQTQFHIYLSEGKIFSKIYFTVLTFHIQRLQTSFTESNEVLTA